MSESMLSVVKCQDPGDGSGDVIIELSQDILESMGLSVGDSLTLDLIAGSIELRPIRGAGAQPKAITCPN